MQHILIKNAEIITMNERNDIVYGDLYIVGDRIAAIGKELSPEKVDRVIDGTNRTIVPGFIHTHIHLCQTMFRGQGDDLELMDWLQKKIWPLEAAHDEESIYYSALLGIGELIKSGTTTIVDMETVHHTDSAFEAIAQSGIRAIAGKVMMDKKADNMPKALQETTASSIAESVRLLEKWHGSYNNRIQYAFSPRFVISCTEDLLREVAHLSAAYDVHVHTHASENQEEIRIVEAETGMRNILYLDHLGLANERLILAHCVWLNDQEKAVIKDRGVKVSHCPGSNMKLASGFAEIPHLHEQGICLSLGADGAPCNNNLDMFNEMRLAATIHKPSYGPTAMNAKHVLEMATIGGAKAVGLENEIGSIEVGKKADLAMLNLYQLHTFPSYGVDPISRVVYSATRGDVEIAMVDGQIVMDNRVLKTIDEKIVLKEANGSIERLLKRVSLLTS
ncbi:N-ethylammeline chlorohydrolase [Priestia aryabhattai]|uniref:5'-deoxyadenosine deaminase n=1 Tax=Priestia flexa TaxID=86664 RepID=UPI000BA157D4|nr:N-ethylammeline chlorohydrolase [Priestia aryabhattai]USY55993.1 5'-deoxyadenosine deaminase [Bacillus sp. 1780r2a1]